MLGDWHRRYEPEPGLRDILLGLLGLVAAQVVFIPICIALLTAAWVIGWLLGWH